MAGHDEGQQVVAQLGGVHAALGFGVFALQQQVQKVGHPVMAAGAARLHGLVGHALHLLDGIARHQPARTRHPIGKPEDVEQGNLASLGNIGVDAPVHLVGIEGAIARKGHIGDHVEGCAHHVLGHVHGARAGRRDAVAAALGGGGHDRGKVHHVAVRENRRGRAALPAPMRAFRDEERLADRGAQQVLGNDGFGIVVELFQKHSADRAGVHHHVPAFARLARHHRLQRGDLRDNAEHVAARRLEAGPDAHRFGHERDVHGDVGGGHGTLCRCHCKYRRRRGRGKSLRARRGCGIGARRNISRGCRCCA